MDPNCVVAGWDGGALAHNRAHPRSGRAAGLAGLGLSLSSHTPGFRDGCRRMLTTGYAWVVVSPLNSKKGVAVDEDQLTAARKHPRSRAESPLRGCSDDRSCGDQAPRRIDQISPPSVTTYAVLPMNSSEVGWFRCQATGVNPPSPSTMRSRPVLVSAGACHWVDTAGCGSARVACDGRDFQRNRVLVDRLGLRPGADRYRSWTPLQSTLGVGSGPPRRRRRNRPRRAGCDEPRGYRGTWCTVDRRGPVPVARSRTARHTPAAPNLAVATAASSA
jgi:hypothetical protein